MVHILNLIGIFILAEVEEEVFAEDYDDQDEDGKYKSNANFDTSGGFTRENKMNCMVRSFRWLFGS